MARPIKNNADYFPHDADMRNDPRVKALRRKFNHLGYAIYSMVVEYLTHAEHFQVNTDKLGIELMAGDFDIETDKLEDILNYCTDIGLLQNNKGVLSCKSLEKRLTPLLSKRERDRDYVIANDKHTVKESKVKESKEENNTISKAVFLLLQRKGSNTMEVTSMVQQWINEGHKDILTQLKAMKAYYARQGLVFPSKIETLTKSFMEADWIEKLKETDPEQQAKIIQNGKQHKAEPDLIGSSKPGSLE
jgi:hypothetical protein